MTTKICTKCNVEKNLEEFFKRTDKLSGYGSQCKPCKAKVSKDYKDKNREKVRKWNRESNERNKEVLAVKQGKRRFLLRADVIRRLGSVCKKCPYTDFRALQIDHINSDGKEDRVRFKGNREKYLKYLLKLDYNILIANYQILCANCNAIKRMEAEEYGESKTSRWQSSYFN